MAHKTGMPDSIQEATVRPAGRPETVTTRRPCRCAVWRTAATASATEVPPPGPVLAAMASRYISEAMPR